MGYYLIKLGSRKVLVNFNILKNLKKELLSCLNTKELNPLENYILNIQESLYF